MDNLFSKKKEKLDPDKAQQEIKELAKQKFIDNVLKDSNQLRKQSELLAQQLGKFIPPQMHKAMMRGDLIQKLLLEEKNLQFFLVT